MTRHRADWRRFAGLGEGASRAPPRATHLGFAHQEAPHDWFDYNTTLLNEGRRILDGLNLR